jgi:hypothetical protein
LSTLVIKASYLRPSVDQRLPPGAVSIIVNINLPLNGVELALKPISINGEAVSGSTVHDLELWMDGVFCPTKLDTSPVDQATISANWLWMPAEAGTQRLIVHPIGSGGRRGQFKRCACFGFAARENCRFASNGHPARVVAPQGNA